MTEQEDYKNSWQNIVKGDCERLSKLTGIEWSVEIFAHGDEPDTYTLLREVVGKPYKEDLGNHLSAKEVLRFVYGYTLALEESNE